MPSTSDNQVCRQREIILEVVYIYILTPPSTQSVSLCSRPGDGAVTTKTGQKLFTSSSDNTFSTSYPSFHPLPSISFEGFTVRYFLLYLNLDALPSRTSFLWISERSFSMLHMVSDILGCRLMGSPICGFFSYTSFILFRASLKDTYKRAPELMGILDNKQLTGYDMRNNMFLVALQLIALQ